jgi:hypothetical protein
MAFLPPSDVLSSAIEEEEKTNVRARAPVARTQRRRTAPAFVTGYRVYSRDDPLPNLPNLRVLRHSCFDFEATRYSPTIRGAWLLDRLSIPTVSLVAPASEGLCIEFLALTVHATTLREDFLIDE